MATYAACYTKIEAAYMGQLLEWPEVITEGATLEKCRAMLLDVAQEMTSMFRSRGPKGLRRSFPFFQYRTIQYFAPEGRTSRINPLPSAIV